MFSKQNRLGVTNTQGRTVSGGRREWMAGLLLSALFCVVACDKMGAGGKKDNTAKDQPAQGAGGAPDTSTIKVGHFGSMSGNESTFGQSTDNGIRLALEEINAAGGVKGRKLEIITIDTESKPEMGGTTVTRLITENKVVAILGEVASSISLAGAPVAQTYGVPMITPSSTNPKVTQVGNMIFRMCFMDDFQGDIQARFVSEDLKLKKAAILFDKSSAYSEGLANYFEQSFTKSGGTITTKQAYPKGTTDYVALLQSIKASNPDIIVVPGYYTEVGTIAEQARKIGITQPLLGGDGWESPKLIEIGGKALEGSYYSNHYSVDEPRPEVQEFVTKYKAKYGGVAPDSLAALGYDSLKLLAAAMEKSPSLSGIDLQATLAATKDFHGVTGTVAFDEGRNARKVAAMLQVKDGKTVFVKHLAPAGMEVPGAAPAVAPAAAPTAGVTPPADPTAAPAAPAAAAPAAPEMKKAPEAAKAPSAVAPN